MTNETVKILGYSLLLELENLLKEQYGNKYPIKITKTDMMFTFCTDSFIISYSFEDRHFYLSFIIGQQGREISKDLINILTILDPHEVTVLEDSYFDKDEQALVFGMEAIHSKQKDILLEAGKVKCPVCEKIYNIKDITTTGICKYCDLDAIAWN